MADKLNPEIPITLDRERHLKFGFRAMRAFEKETGKNILKTQSSPDGTTASDVAVLLWACLIDEDRTLTLDAAIDLMDKYSTIGEIAEKLRLAQEAAAPEANKGTGVSKDAAPLAVKPRTGSKSGALPG